MKLADYILLCGLFKDIFAAFVEGEYVLKQNTRVYVVPNDGTLSGCISGPAM